ncbi:diarrheal toxin/FtsK/SpoIIIE family protein [Listeria monocytogenes 07PF0776]|nr:diarrheal toxin/FtsK/SpoIIIE family protein [Listeria monocytogenes 07PF0776]
MSLEARKNIVRLIENGPKLGITLFPQAKREFYIELEMKYLLKYENKKPVSYLDGILSLINKIYKRSSASAV